MRTFDPTVFNKVANEPEVRPWLGGEGELDLTATVRNPANFAMQMDERGGFLGIPIFGTGTYEVHTIFSSADREPTAIVEYMRKCLEFMFYRTDAVELITRVPDGNVGAKWLAHKGGFREIAVQPRWNGGSEAATVKRLWIEDWACSSTTAVAAGEEFHRSVAAKRWPLGEHSEDDGKHDAIAGAGILMALGGQPLKAVNFYNHWAVIAGYPLVRLLAAAPVVVDMGEGVVAWESGGKMEIALCR